jgi:hypothetical protein
MARVRLGGQVIEVGLLKKLLLRPFAVGDVEARSKHTEGSSLCIRRDLRSGGDPPFRSVRADDPEFNVMGTTPFQSLRDRLLDREAVFGVDHPEELAAGR